jgi:glycosyltransferase involved in cell wall biosynthesis
MMKIKNSNMEYSSKISVAICTYNRAKYLVDSLKSLKNQNLNPDDFEIIIVDNNSSDATAEISKIFINQNPGLNVSCYKENRQGLSFARNKAITESKYDIITFIDDDAIAREDFLANILSYFKDHSDVDALGGKVIPIYENGIEEPQWLSKYLWGIVTKVDYGDEVKIFPAPKYPAGCNMSFRKEKLLEVGLFNTDLKIRGDDKDIFAKLNKIKAKVYYVPEVFVYHNVEEYRLTKSFIKKLSIIIGNSERVRLADKGLMPLILKLFEYLFKLVAGFIIASSFIFKGQVEKAKYLIMVRWTILKGLFVK